MRNRRQYPRAHEPTIIRRKHGQGMAHDEDRAKLQERPLARLRRSERDNDRAADRPAKRIAADRRPAREMLTSRLAAMSGSKPTIANSVVPMAKVARKSANSKGDMDGLLPLECD